MMQSVAGNILHSCAQAVVNPVNCVGIMGNGLAAQFKRQYPDNFIVYRRACASGRVRPGKLLVFQCLPSLDGPRYIINFPTKRHWSNPSRLEDIQAGLVQLRKIIINLGLTSVALPKIGCGEGGLPWERVRALIEAELGGLSGTDIELYDKPDIKAATPERTGVPENDLPVIRKAPF